MNALKKKPVARRLHPGIELALVLTAAILPTFAMAGHISADEFVKGGATGTALVVMAAWKAWKGQA